MNPLGLFLEPPGPLLTHLHAVCIAYSECLPTRLNPLAERTCFSQVGALQCRGPRPRRGLQRPRRAGALPCAEQRQSAAQARLAGVRGQAGRRHRLAGVEADHEPRHGAGTARATRRPVAAFAAADRIRAPLLRARAQVLLTRALRRRAAFGRSARRAGWRATSRWASTSSSAAGSGAGWSTTARTRIWPTLSSLLFLERNELEFSLVYATKF